MKLNNYFKDHLPKNYRDFRLSVHKMSSNEAVVAELLRICCEEDNVQAIKLFFERTLGKPEKTIIIKRTSIRMEYPNATQKALKPQGEVETTAISPLENKVVIEEKDSPGWLLNRALDKIGESGQEYAYEVIEDKDRYPVIEVLAANLYAIAMRGGNLNAITLLFDYLDGSVADVIRLDDQDTILLENYAEQAPYNAIQDEDGIWYVEEAML